MAHWLNDTLTHLYAGETLMRTAVQGLADDWQSSVDFVWKLGIGSERWHAALQNIETPVTLADIFRTRVTFP